MVYSPGRGRGELIIILRSVNGAFHSINIGTHTHTQFSAVTFKELNVCKLTDRQTYGWMDIKRDILVGLNVSR